MNIASTVSRAIPGSKEDIMKIVWEFKHHKNVTTNSLEHRKYNGQCLAAWKMAWLKSTTYMICKVTKWERCLDHHAEHGLVGNPLHQWNPFSGRENLNLLVRDLTSFGQRAGFVERFCPKIEHLQNAT